jgi:parallel beta-helix repeat protein
VIRTRATASAVALLCVAGMAATLAPTTAVAKKIEVRRGPNALQKAIDRASAGDKLRVHRGRYRESVVVDKPLQIVNRSHKKKRRRPVIDAGCDDSTTIAVRSPGVRLRGLKVVGSGVFGVDFHQVETGRARKLWVKNTCGPDSEYGINLTDTGAIKLIRNRTEGYPDAGIYVGEITDAASGELLISRNDSFGNRRGLVVENSVPAADIVVDGNRFHDNTVPGTGDPSGIFVHNSDGVIFSNNVADSNAFYGIHLDLDSDLNRLFENVFEGNGVQNIRNDGSGNCGSGNSPNPFPPC